MSKTSSGESEWLPAGKQDFLKLVLPRIANIAAPSTRRGAEACTRSPIATAAS